jgi:hypothetical protein
MSDLADRAMTDHDIKELVERLLGSVDAIKFSEHVPILFADEMAEAAQALTTLQAENALIRQRIPMDYLERHEGDLPAAMKDYAEDRWKLMERYKALKDRAG